MDRPDHTENAKSDPDQDAISRWAAAQAGFAVDLRELRSDQLDAVEATGRRYAELLRSLRGPAGA